MNGLDRSDREEEIHPVSILDIREETCPMTFVRVRLALDRLQPGQILEVHLRGEEPRRNVPRTALEQGHRIVKIEDRPEGEMRLLLQRGG